MGKIKGIILLGIMGVFALFAAFFGIFCEEGEKSQPALKESEQQLLDAYSRRDSAKLDKLLAEMDEESGWTSLFYGISFYWDRNFGQALEKFQKFSPLTEEHPFGSHFSDQWLGLHIAHCQIEMGNLFATRQGLENTLKEPSQGDRCQINFLIGLSYFKEAKNKTYDLAVPYYNLAFSYFNRSQLEGAECVQDRKGILIDVQNKIEQIVVNRSFQYLPFYADLIAKWGSEDNMNQVSESLVHLFEEEIQKREWENFEKIVLVLNQLLPDGIRRDQLQNQMEQLFDQALKEGKIEDVEKRGKFLIAFSKRPEDVPEKLSAKVMKYLLLTISQDDQYLSKTDPLFQYWDSLSLTPEQQKRGIQQLLVAAQRMWKEEREKVVTLIQKIKNVSPSNPVEVEKWMQNLYTDAVRTKGTRDLTALLEVADTLELAQVEIPDQKQITKQLEIVNSLYSHQRYEEARKKSESILAREPGNNQAKKMLGMIAYQEGDYASANENFEYLESEEIERKLAMGISLILEGDRIEGEKYFQELKNEDPRLEGVYLRLMWGFLDQDDPIAALEWMGKVKNHPKEVLAGRCFAAFAMQSWEEVLDICDKLPDPYRGLDSFKGLTIEALTSIGDIEQAQKQLDTLIGSPAELGVISAAPSFKTFKKTKLDQWNRNFVAAMFYKVVKEDLSTALHFFNKIENPGLLAKIEKAEVLLTLGQSGEGEKYLHQVLSETKGAKNAGEIKRRLYPLLGSHYAKLGYFEGAVFQYHNFFELFPNEITFRIEYAKMLMHVMRYDLALEQFQILMRTIELSKEERIQYLDTLVHAGQFARANTFTNEWMKQETLPLADQLKIARLMWITKNKSLLDQIIKNIPEPSKRTIEDNKELIRLWIDLGRYEDAQELVEGLQRELKKSSEGLMVLVDFYVQLSQYDQALDFAQEAALQNPSDFTIADFIARYERAPETIVKSIQMLKEKLQGDPDNITLKLNYVNDLIDVAIEAVHTQEVSSLDRTPEINLARSTLLEVLEQTEDLPKVYFLLGKIEYLTDHEEKAKEALLKAIRLNASYIEAYQLLGLIYEDKKQWIKAIATVKNGLLYDPNDGEIWEQLARLYILSGDVKEAIHALQQAILYTPNEPLSYLKIAELYLQTKRPEDAIDNLEKLFTFSYENKEGVKLMLRALYDPHLEVSDQEAHKKRQGDMWDRLESLDPVQMKQLREILEG